jgi:hypothetical protein
MKTSIISKAANKSSRYREYRIHRPISGMPVTGVPKDRRKKGPNEELSNVYLALALAIFIVAMLVIFPTLLSGIF